MKNIKLKFECINGIILLPVTINDIEGFVAFDTGAMHTCLNKKYFDNLGTNNVKISKFDEKVMQEDASRLICNIKCFEWELSDYQALLIDMSYVENPLNIIKKDIRFLGTLGIDIISEHNISIDYNNKYIMLDSQRPNGLTYFNIGKSALPVIDVFVNGYKCKLVLDTGANTCLIDNKLQLKGIVMKNDKIGQIDKILALGNTYNDITCVLSNIDNIKSVIDVSGVIGYQILSNHFCYIDFNEGVIGIK